MLIGISLMIIIVITLLSLVIGEDFVSGVVNLEIDNEALVDNITNTFVVEGQDVLFQINTSNLIEAGIALLVVIIAVAVVTGITFLASGINPQSARIIVFLTGYIGIWGVLTVLAFNLIRQIEVFGSVIYISLTLTYITGVIQKLSGAS